LRRPLLRNNSATRGGGDRISGAFPDDLDEEALEAIPEPPEQAELDAIFEQLHAVRDHDRWPRELYFKNV
jgi:hypothetical protein